MFEIVIVTTNTISVHVFLLILASVMPSVSILATIFQSLYSYEYIRLNESVVIIVSFNSLGKILVASAITNIAALLLLVLPL